MAKDHPIIGMPHDIPLDPRRGLAIIDVDEVLALFVRGFNQHLRAQGYEWRLQSFALFPNIYLSGADVPVSIELGRALYQEFFAVGCGALEPAPGAAEGLAKIADLAQVIILTNAPEPARALRGHWLKAHGMDYPMILGEGLKGPPVAVLAGRTRGPVMFVDDLLSNLDSVAEAAPRVTRFQMVAEPELRKMAPSRPELHRFVEDWDELVGLAGAVFAP